MKNQNTRYTSKRKMSNKFTVIKILLLIGFVYVWSGCNTHTEERVDKQEKVLPNKKHITVEKITKETTSVGIFTNHNYGTSHSYRYKFLIQPEDINWDGGSGEPKQLLFCKDTIYMRYLKKKNIQIQYIDSVDNTMKTKHHWETKEVFQKHIDERYFFNFFGKDYWVDISPENYVSLKKSCKEYDIPNDNELLLKPVLERDGQK